MELKSSFNKKVNIASIEAVSKDHKLKVHTLLQSEKQKQPSINAYLGARYSRSADSIVDIASEVLDSGADAAKRLETIFQGYGHKSVGDMAGIFVCIENIPIFLAQKLFYMNPVHSGQERSTRYQNFEEPKFVGMPEDTPEEVSSRYEELIREWMRNYREVMSLTKDALKTYFKPEKGDKNHKSALQARTFDTARFFLPIGLETSLALSMSARSWAELIGYLRGSNMHIARELADMLFVLLTGNEELEALGYVPEADGLIRHTEANNTRNDSTTKVLGKLEPISGELKKLQIKKPQCKNSRVIMKHDPVDDVLKNYLLLLNSQADVEQGVDFSDELKEKLGEALFQSHNHHNQIGTLAQTGAILIEGFGDYGSVLKDINRHRSLERVFPLLEDYLDIDAELDRAESDLYFLCDYLEIAQLDSLKADYDKRFQAMYAKVKEWSKNAKGKIDENLRREYTRYLLPHAHAARYRLYGSVDDWQYLIHLRSRNGGHIAYRKLTYDWLQKLAKASPIFGYIEQKLEEVDAASRDQFFDRS